MQSVGFRFNRESRCRNYVLILAFCWVFSITAGVILAISLQDIPSSLMRSVVISPVSIVGLTVVLLLPVVLSAVAVRFTLPWGIYAIAIMKGVSFGFSIYILLISYYGAGWLIGCLVMFSNICMQVPLFLFWLRHIDGSTQHLLRDTITCLVLTIVIGCVDYHLISPFVLTLNG